MDYFKSTYGESDYQLTNKVAGTMIPGNSGALGFGHYPESTFFFAPQKESKTDVVVNERTAAGYAPLWRAWNIYCGYVSKLPINLVDSNDVVLRHRPEHKMLAKLPHPWLHSQNFRKTIQFHAGKFGNGYALIDRLVNGTPHSFSILDPRTTKVVVELRNPDSGKAFEELLQEVEHEPTTETVQELLSSCDSQLFYSILIKSGHRQERIKAPHTDVFHIRGLSNDGLTGEDILTIFQREIGLGIAARENKYAFYRNGGVKGGVLMFQKGTSPDKQMETMRYWDQVRTGVDAAYRVARIGDDTKFQENGANSKDMQTNETREFQIAMASDITGVPQHKLGGKRNTAYASLEQENKSFLDDSLDDILCQWENESGMKVIPETWIDDTETFRFDRTKLQQPSFQELVEGTAKLVNEGIGTGNEGRKRIGLKASSNPCMDKERMPLNIGFCEQNNTELSNQQTTQLRNVVQRQIEISYRRLTRAAIANSSSPEAMNNFLASMEEKHRAAIDNYMSPVNELLGECTRKPIPDLLDQFFTLMSTESDRISNESPDEFKQQISDVARSVISDWPNQLVKSI